MHQSRRETSSDIAQGPPISSCWPPVDRKWVFLSATCLQNERPRRVETSACLALPCLPVIQGGWVFVQQSKMDSKRPIKSSVHAGTKDRTTSMCLVHASQRLQIFLECEWEVAQFRVAVISTTIPSGLSLLLQMKVTVKKKKARPLQHIYTYTGGFNKATHRLLIYYNV